METEPVLQVRCSGKVNELAGLYAFVIFLYEIIELQMQQIWALNARESSVSNIKMVNESNNVPNLFARLA